MKKNKKIRRLGDIMLDLEPLLFELHLDHDLQHSDVLGLINFWQRVHVPNSIETYLDNTHPIFYGPKGNFKRYNILRKAKNKSKK